MTKSLETGLLSLPDLAPAGPATVSSCDVCVEWLRLLDEATTRGIRRDQSHAATELVIHRSVDRCPQYEAPALIRTRDGMLVEVCWACVTLRTNRSESGWQQQAVAARLLQHQQQDCPAQPQTAVEAAP